MAAFVFLLVTGNTAQVMAKSRKVTVIKTVLFKDRKEKSNEENLHNEAGGKKKLKITVSPKKGKI